MGSAALAAMHVGAVVEDLEAAVAEHSALGIGPWAVSGALRFTTFDGALGEVVDQDVRIAFGRLPGGGALELVEPAASTPDSPQRRLLVERAGVTHHAFWCRTVAQAAGPLLDRGAAVFTASVPEDVPWRQLLADGGERALLGAVGAAYLRLATGAIVELVSVSVAPSLRTMVGPDIEAIVPVPVLA